MLKRIAHLPFRALGKVARAVQAREAAQRAAHEATRPAREAEARTRTENIPGYDVPDAFEPVDVDRKARELVAELKAGATLRFVDVRAKRTVTIPGAQHLPLATLGIDLAELPPAGHPIVVYCDDGAASRRAVRFLRFRGIEDAVLLVGGLSAWQSAKGPVEPARES
jgi:rhodanese-related sulfurtransferase